MKLRIRGNSIRLRLTEREVEGLAAGRRITETTDFGGGGRLTYAVEAQEDQRQPGARLSNGGAGSEVEVLVRLPAAQVRAWAAGDDEGLYGEETVGEGERLSLAVEKDFRCLTPRSAAEDPPDAYPHPQEGKTRC
jgi:hypothetical protein